MDLKPKAGMSDTFVVKQKKMIEHVMNFPLNSKTYQIINKKSVLKIKLIISVRNNNPENSTMTINGLPLLSLLTIFAFCFLRKITALTIFFFRKIEDSKVLTDP